MFFSHWKSSCKWTIYLHERKRSPVSPLIHFPLNLPWKKAAISYLALALMFWKRKKKKKSILKLNTKYISGFLAVNGKHFLWIDLLEWPLSVLLGSILKSRNSMLNEVRDWNKLWNMPSGKKRHLIQQNLGATLNGKVTLIKRFLYRLHWINYFWVRFTNIIAGKV